MSTKVVIVEDDTLLARHYGRVLAREGFDLHYATHALGAIDLIDDVMPDVIVLDLLLTGTTALTLLHELTSHTDLAAIPVVLLSTVADAVQFDDMKPYGVMRLLDKATMHPRDLVAAVRMALP